MSGRRNQTTQNRSLQVLKNAIVVIFNTYISKWKFSKLGHHHNRRAKNVRNAIQAVETLDELYAILETQGALFFGDTFPSERREALPNQIEKANRYLDPRWTDPARLKNKPPQELKKSKYCRILQASNKLAAPELRKAFQEHQELKRQQREKHEQQQLEQQQQLQREQQQREQQQLEQQQQLQREQQQREQQQRDKQKREQQQRDKQKREQQQREEEHLREQRLREKQEAINRQERHQRAAAGKIIVEDKESNNLDINNYKKNDWRHLAQPLICAISERNLSMIYMLLDMDSSGVNKENSFPQKRTYLFAKGTPLYLCIHFYLNSKSFYCRESKAKQRERLNQTKNIIKALVAHGANIDDSVVKIVNEDICLYMLNQLSINEQQSALKNKHLSIIEEKQKKKEQQQKGKEQRQKVAEIRKNKESDIAKNKKREKHKWDRYQFKVSSRQRHKQSTRQKIAEKIIHEIEGGPPSYFRQDANYVITNPEIDLYCPISARRLTDPVAVIIDGQPCSIYQNGYIQDYLKCNNYCDPISKQAVTGLLPVPDAATCVNTYIEINNVDSNNFSMPYAYYEYPKTGNRSCFFSEALMKRDVLSVPKIFYEIIQRMGKDGESSVNNSRWNNLLLDHLRIFPYTHIPRVFDADPRGLWNKYHKDYSNRHKTSAEIQQSIEKEIERYHFDLRSSLNYHISESLHEYQSNIQDTNKASQAFATFIAATSTLIGANYNHYDRSANALDDGLTQCFYPLHQAVLLLRQYCDARLDSSSKTDSNHHIERLEKVLTLEHARLSCLRLFSNYKNDISRYSCDKSITSSLNLALCYNVVTSTMNLLWLTTMEFVQDPEFNDFLVQHGWDNKTINLTHHHTDHSYTPNSPKGPDDRSNSSNKNRPEKIKDSKKQANDAPELVYVWATENNVDFYPTEEEMDDYNSDLNYLRNLVYQVPQDYKEYKSWIKRALDQIKYIIAKLFASETETALVENNTNNVRVRNLNVCGL